MAGLALPLYAQAPPSSPNLKLTLHPDLTFNVWPADFDRDGRTDLVAGTATGSLWPRRPTDLVIRLGRGDGTFLPARSLGRAALPLGVGDFNADGFVDIVIREGDAIAVLPGRTGATFAAPRPVGPTNYPVDEIRVWAHVADFDGDGRRDILVPEMYDTLKLYRGNGDLTFQPAVDLFTQGGGYQPADATSGDFNGDGRRDIAVASPLEIDVFINTGGVSYSRSVIPGAEFSDITTRDLNNDGRLDLVASSGSRDFHYPYTTPGAVHVLIGNGNGTFQPWVRHETGVLGSMSIVVGEFTGDGILDVATGNRSVVDDPDLGRHFWDSLSVFPGDGPGGLSAPTTYALGTVQPEYGWFDPESPVSGQPSPAEHVRSQRRRPHRPDRVARRRRPEPAAGRCQPATVRLRRTRSHGVRLRLQHLPARPGCGSRHALAHLHLDDEAGRVLNYAGLSTAQVSQDRGTTRTYTLTVADGQGGVSSDTVTIYVPLETDPWLGVAVPGTVLDAIVAGEPYTIRWSIYDAEGVLTSASLSYSLDDGRTFTAVPGCQNLPPRTGQCVWQNPGPVSDLVRLRLVAASPARNFVLVTQRTSIVASPGGWTSADVGAVGAAGHRGLRRRRMDRRGFRRRHLGDGGRVPLRVSLRLRELRRHHPRGEHREPRSLGEGRADDPRDAGSGLAPCLAVRHAAHRARHRIPAPAPTDGISVHTAGPAVAPPGWLTLGRVGDTISAYYRASATDAWTLVGRETLAGLAPSVIVGLAVSSHVDGALATARFDNVSGRDRATGRVTGRRAPSAWPGAPRSTASSTTCARPGTDIWGTADAFRIVNHGPSSYGPNAEITARVRSLENTHAWAKAGVMFRQSPPIAQSPHVMVVVTPGHGVAMQYRATITAGRACRSPCEPESRRSGSASPRSRGCSAAMRPRTA